MDAGYVDEIYKKLGLIVAEIENVVVGKREAVKMLLVALLAGGHVLIEDVPGVGKTTLATALGKATDLTFKRAQFTPDVMASDITGFNLYNKETGKFEFRQGLVMTNILLADEINRTSPKTQSALLEAMEEQNVTVDGTTYALPRPFMVIATQNEVGYVGTFPLPEAQLDRFMIKIAIGYPTLEQEVNIISNRQENDPLKNVKAVCSRDDIAKISEMTRHVNVEQSIYKYIVRLVSETRSHSAVILGASPRASLALMRSSQALAFLSGRNYVTPEDVGTMLPYILTHRIHLKQEAKIKGITVEAVLNGITKTVNPPIKRNDI